MRNKCPGRLAYSRHREQLAREVDSDIAWFVSLGFMERRKQKTHYGGFDWIHLWGVRNSSGLSGDWGKRDIDLTCDHRSVDAGGEAQSFSISIRKKWKKEQSIDDERYAGVKTHGGAGTPASVIEHSITAKIDTADTGEKARQGSWPKHIHPPDALAPGKWPPDLQSHETSRNPASARTTEGTMREP